MGPNTSQSSQGTVDSWPERIVSPGRDTILRSDGGMLQFQPTKICHEQMTPATAGAAVISASHVGAAAAGTRNAVLLALAAKILTPRNIVITVTHGTSVIAMNGVITGKDAYGKTITEAWAVTATGTTKTFTGKKAFASISSITETVAANASTNTIVMGTGVAIGLAFRAVSPTILSELTDAAVPTAGAIAIGAGASATLDYRGTYTSNTAPNGSHIYDLWYLVDDPTDI